MRPEKANLRSRTTLKPGIKSLIIKRAIENPTLDRTILAQEIINEIIRAHEKPPTLETTISYISKARSKYSKDNPWNMAALNIEPIIPDAVPWLMATQSQMKECLSKPLTIREAKWFSRLFGFRNTMRAVEEIENNSEIKQYFLRNVIAEWSHIYAYREKIDIIANVKEPDYSELDHSLLSLNYKTIYEHSDKLLESKMFDFVNSAIFEKVTKEGLNKWGHKYLAPHNLEQIRFIELRFMGHSLGEPDLEPNSLSLYNKILAITGNDELGYFEKLIKLSYLNRIEFFKGFRQLCKNNTDELKNKDLSECISNALDSMMDR
jgi:hypothetical protein